MASATVSFVDQLVLSKEEHGNYLCVGVAVDEIRWMK